jgi:hypothetical protein
MAIVQISQITNRKGLAVDLPQLAGAELGWSTDTRQLFIGNGTLADGAPVIGNTEILTEYSDILALITGNRAELQLGTYVIKAGQSAPLDDAVAAAEPIFTIDATLVQAFTITYTIRRGTAFRTGTVFVATESNPDLPSPSNDLNTMDQNAENKTTGIDFVITQSGGTVTVGYTSTATGQAGTLLYSVSYLA